ncbi:UDP-galactose/UDP-N-acetylglucosamine transporter srf-3 [Trichinella pseudospiralis]|uniref:UDP-galactose/UDP-N-acetylglucosamine transporter srf-3 n=1 Tax=Trichinella pseudospiralis TaxID=6337 RepID=A0A0V1FH01_TRIPS|nr:UDP-galactose/UDP-N-acetylglucosamine transporter srf-3 [Trichinella pseudospiralis]
MKWLSLILLVIQNITQSILIHYSKVRPKAVNYLQTSVVFWSEIVKLVISICAFICEENQGPIVATKIIYNGLSNTVDTVKVSGLSLLYTVQNNLVFYAAAHLEPSLFQVLLQAKLLFTAIFSVCILKKSLSKVQWIALLLLTAGMAMAQINQHQSVHVTQSTKLDHSIQETWLGATALSGFSGVYLEKILKHTKPSLWLRNVQLAISAVPISAILLIMEQSTPPKRRLFHDYDWLVVLLILWFASGGIIVALAIKHADNILKGFANALAIVVTSLCSIYLFDFRPSREFCFGVALVILSIGLYVGNWSAQTTTPPYQKIDTNSDHQLSDVVYLKTFTEKHSTNSDGDESITHKSVHNRRKRSTTFINIVVSTSDLKRILNHAAFVHQYQLHN